LSQIGRYIWSFYFAKVAQYKDITTKPRWTTVISQILKTFILSWSKNHRRSQTLSWGHSWDSSLPLLSFPAFPLRFFSLFRFFLYFKIWLWGSARAM